MERRGPHRADSCNLYSPFILPLVCVAVDIDKVVELYDHYTSLVAENDALRAKRNENTKAMKGKLEAEVRTRGYQQRTSVRECQTPEMWSN